MDSAGVEMPTRSDYREQIDRGLNPLIVRSVADVDVLFDYVFARGLALPTIFKRIFASEGMARVEAYETIFSQLFERETALQPLLERIEAPTLLMWGKQDRVLDLSMLEIFEPRLRHHTTVLYDACGHLPYMENPAQASADHRKLIERQTATLEQNPV
jgi:pimeloyl-ACP methyl ester carboxylesterase